MPSQNQFPADATDRLLGKQFDDREEATHSEPQFNGGLQEFSPNIPHTIHH